MDDIELQRRLENTLFAQMQRFRASFGCFIRDIAISLRIDKLATMLAYPLSDRPIVTRDGSGRRVLLRKSQGKLTTIHDGEVRILGHGVYQVVPSGEMLVDDNGRLFIASTADGRPVAVRRGPPPWFDLTLLDGGEVVYYTPGTYYLVATGERLYTLDPSAL